MFRAAVGVAGASSFAKNQASAGTPEIEEAIRRDKVAGQGAAPLPMMVA